MGRPASVALLSADEATAAERAEGSPVGVAAKFPAPLRTVLSPDIIGGKVAPPPEDAPRDVGGEPVTVVVRVLLTVLVIVLLEWVGALGYSVTKTSLVVVTYTSSPKPLEDGAGSTVDSGTTVYSGIIPLEGDTVDSAWLEAA